MSWKAGCWSAAAAIVVWLVPAAGFAQSADRGFVSVNGGYQATSTEFRNTVPFTLHAENSELAADYDVEPAPALDVAGGVRVWRHLGIGVGVTRFTKATDSNVQASLPHPFFFGQLREVSGPATGVNREELAVHLQAVLMFIASPRVQISLFGGPSFFDVKQGLVSEAQFTESYPFDVAEFTGVAVARRSESAVGFNAGFDLSYLFTRHVGVGGVLRFSRASVDLPGPEGGSSVRVDLGGAQIGAGLRLRF